MNPKQKQYFDNLQKNLEGGAVQPDEMVQIVEFILTVIEKLKTDIESQITDANAESSTSIKEISYSLNELELKVKDLINSSERTSLSQIKELSSRLSSEINRVQDSIPSLPDLSYLEAKIAEVESKIPVLKEQLIETPDQVVDKVNLSSKKFSQDKIEGLVSIINDLMRMASANANSMPVTTSFFNGLRGKNLNIVGATATQSGDTVNIVVSSTGLVLTTTGTSGPATLVGNTLNIPQYTGGASSGYQVPTGTVDGSNKVYVYSTAPNAVVVDGVTLRKTASDGTNNWTGTTTITLLVAPTFDTFSVA